MSINLRVLLVGLLLATPAAAQLPMFVPFSGFSTAPVTLSEASRYNTSNTPAWIAVDNGAGNTCVSPSTTVVATGPNPYTSGFCMYNTNATISGADVVCHAWADANGYLHPWGVPTYALFCNGTPDLCDCYGGTGGGSNFHIGNAVRGNIVYDRWGFDTATPEPFTGSLTPNTYHGATITKIVVHKYANSIAGQDGLTIQMSGTGLAQSFFTTVEVNGGSHTYTSASATSFTNPSPGVYVWFWQAVYPILGESTFNVIFTP